MLSVSGLFGGAGVVSLHKHHVLNTVLHKGHWALFGLCFYTNPNPATFPLIIYCDGCLVLMAQGLMTERHGNL